MIENNELARRKSALRAKLRNRRSQQAGFQENPWSQQLLPLLVNLSTVACYASVPPEPDTWEIIASLDSAGIRVILPILSSEPTWANYEGPNLLEPGARGIWHPTTPRLSADALATAEAIVMPGLAGTKSGDRLGQGGGWYDRALQHANPSADRIMLLFDEELLPQLPVATWDQNVDWIVTETRMLHCREYEGRVDTGD